MYPLLSMVVLFNLTRSKGTTTYHNFSIFYDPIYKPLTWKNIWCHKLFPIEKHLLDTTNGFFDYHLLYLSYLVEYKTIFMLILYSMAGLKSYSLNIGFRNERMQDIQMRIHLLHVVALDFNMVHPLVVYFFTILENLQQ